jgi:hypothetical protein
VRGARESRTLDSHRCLRSQLNGLEEFPDKGNDARPVVLESDRERLTLHSPSALRRDREIQRLKSCGLGRLQCSGCVRFNNRNARCLARGVPQANLVACDEADLDKRRENEEK